jgi:hypothetical protein
MNLAAKARATLTSSSDNYVGLPLVLVFFVGASLTAVWTLLTAILAFLLFSLPGFLIFRRLTTSPARAFVYGVPLGYSLTSLLIITVVGIYGWHITAITLTYAVGLLVLILSLHLRRTPHIAPPPQTDRLPLVVALGVGMLVLTLCVPFAHAGRLTEHGYAFTGLFGHDFLLRAVDSVGLANSIPADNYFFYGPKTVNYYVLWYILPAAIYNVLSKNAQVSEIVMIVSLLEVPIFGALVYYSIASFLRSVSTVRVVPARLGTIFIALFLFCYSYHWLFFFFTRITSPTGPPFLANLSSQMGSVSTSWFKDFLFQPHSVLALMQFLVVMDIAMLAPFRHRGILLGVLFGSLLLTDTVIFLVTGCAFGLWYITQPNMRRHLRELPSLLATAGAIVLLAFFLKILGPAQYSNRIVISPYLTALAGLPGLLLLCLGAIPFFAVAALRDRKLHSSEPRRLMLVLSIVSLFFLLFVTEVLEGNVFLRKSLLTLRLPVLILASTYLYLGWERPLRKLPLLLLALCVPTLFSDVYATSSVHDVRYTMYVTQAEMSAANWLKENTDPDSVVQSLIEYPGPFDYSLTICFGDRRAALGLWKMAYQRYPNKRAITARVTDIQTLFSTADPDERAQLARGLHINYLFIGPRERERFPGILNRLSADTVHFAEAYSSPEVDIFRVRD